MGDKQGTLEPLGICTLSKSALPRCVTTGQESGKTTAFDGEEQDGVPAHCPYTVQNDKTQDTARDRKVAEFAPARCRRCPHSPE